MFKLFKKKTEREKLLDQYEKLMAESHRLSSNNRAASDQKYAEAQAILAKVDALDV